MIDEFLPKVEEWVEASKGKIRADIAHEKLMAMGFPGSERSSRRAIAEIKKQYHLTSGLLRWPGRSPADPGSLSAENTY